MDKMDKMGHTTIVTTTIENYTLKLIKGKNKAEIFLKDEKIWDDKIENHVNAEDKQKSFDEYSNHCLSELSDITNIEEFQKHIGCDDLFQTLSSMGYALAFHFCSEGDFTGRFIDATENY